MVGKILDQTREGGARPEAGRLDADCGESAESYAGVPASISAQRARTAESAAVSAEEPTVQVVQCVLDLRWQTRSW